MSISCCSNLRGVPSFDVSEYNEIVDHSRLSKRHQHQSYYGQLNDQVRLGCVLKVIYPVDRATGHPLPITVSPEYR